MVNVTEKQCYTLHTNLKKDIEAYREESNQRDNEIKDYFKEKIENQSSRMRKLESFQEKTVTWEKFKYTVGASFTFTGLAFSILFWFIGYSNNHIMEKMKEYTDSAKKMNEVLINLRDQQIITNEQIKTIKN